MYIGHGGGRKRRAPRMPIVAVWFTWWFLFLVPGSRRSQHLLISLPNFVFPPLLVLCVSSIFLHFFLPGRSFHSFTTTPIALSAPHLHFERLFLPSLEKPRSSLIDSTWVFAIPPANLIQLIESLLGKSLALLSALHRPAFLFLYSYSGRLCDAPLPPNHPRF